MRKYIGILTLLALCGCSKGDVITLAQIAATGNMPSAEALAKRKAVTYAANPKALDRDIKRFEANFKKLVNLFRKDVEKEWGEGEIREPRPRQYVKYTQNFRSRATVDFDSGIIAVETVDQKDPLESLRNAVVTTLLTPNDPRSVDLYTASRVELGETPFLLGEVLDHQGKQIRWPWRAGQYADYLMKNNLEIRTVTVKGNKEQIHAVRFSMVQDHLHVRAKKYKPLVEKYAGELGVSENLIFAVIKTESNFNPYAVSGAPAFGLMQIVPKSAGREVYRHIYGRDGTPTRQDLFQADTNIRYGVNYLHLLKNRYMNTIADPVAKEYLVIAAYNTGPGNVFRTFDRNRKRAPEKINALSSMEVYTTLKNRLPYKETRRYLTKVLDAKKSFVNL